MRLVEAQLETAARILEEAGDLVPVDVTCVLEQPPHSQPHIQISTPHQLSLADQRSAIDRIATLLDAIPSIHPVFTGRHGASVRGERGGVEVIAVTNAAVPQSSLPERTTTTRDTVAVLRAIRSWAGSIEEHVQELIVHDSSLRHAVHVMVATEEAAERVRFGLVPEESSDRRRRALLPTGQFLTISVVRG